MGEHMQQNVYTTQPRVAPPEQSPQIFAWHSHVYYDASTMAQARRLCETTVHLFGVSVQMGHMHERPVGPHPDWSCQLSYLPGNLHPILPWLALNRNGLVVFTHPVTGDDLRDHRDHAIWMGTVRPLDLTIFEGYGT